VEQQQQELNSLTIQVVDLQSKLEQVIAAANDTSKFYKDQIHWHEEAEKLSRQRASSIVRPVRSGKSTIVKPVAVGFGMSTPSTPRGSDTPVSSPSKGPKSETILHQGYLMKQGGLFG
jgi:hypothetical protein